MSASLVGLAMPFLASLSAPLHDKSVRHLPILLTEDHSTHQTDSASCFWNAIPSRLPHYLSGPPCPLPGQQRAGLQRGRRRQSFPSGRRAAEQRPRRWLRQFPPSRRPSQSNTYVIRTYGDRCTLGILEYSPSAPTHSVCKVEICVLSLMIGV
jgi:hypothetical protein